MGDYSAASPARIRGGVKRFRNGFMSGSGNGMLWLLEAVWMVYALCVAVVFGILIDSLQVNRSCECGMLVENAFVNFGCGVVMAQWFSLRLGFGALLVLYLIC